MGTVGRSARVERSCRDPPSGVAQISAQTLQVGGVRRCRTWWWRLAKVTLSSCPQLEVVTGTMSPSDSRSKHFGPVWSSPKSRACVFHAGAHEGMRKG